MHPDSLPEPSGPLPADTAAIAYRLGRNLALMTARPLTVEGFTEVLEDAREQSGPVFDHVAAIALVYVATDSVRDAALTENAPIAEAIASRYLRSVMDA